MGDIAHADNLSVYVDKIVYGKANNILARHDIDGSGHFDIAFPEGIEPGVYNLRIGAKRLSLILNGEEEKVEIEGDLENLDSYQVTIQGSEGSEQYAALIRGFLEQDYGLEDLQNFVDTTRNGLLASFAAFSLLGPDAQFLELHQGAYEKLQADLPGAEITTSYNNLIKSVEAEYARYMASQRVQIGQEAPDLTMASPDGKEYSLSDLRGKLVLLDFWASWCMPCRQENPNVVKVYEKYKDQGFTIFSVSLDGVNSRTRDRLQTEEQLNRVLDRSRDRWVKAIEDDGLTWPYHVSDLKQWNSDAAQTYGVNAIPRTFFIDREGKIAAINLRGATQIENTIRKHL